MNNQEFLEMMRQDITSDSDNLNLRAVIECMAEVIKNNPDCDINTGNNNLSPQNCFEYLREYAEEHKKTNVYFMAPSESLKLVAKYLGLDAETSTENLLQNTTSIVNLEDFL